MSLITLTKLPCARYYPWDFSLSVHIDSRVKFDEFIRDLKSCLPARSRKWESSRRRWLVKASVEPAVFALLRKHNLIYQYLDERAKVTA